MTNKKNFIPLNIAVLVISDTRTESTDKSGQLLVKRIEDAGHNSFERKIVPDNLEQIRQATTVWIKNKSVDAILTTGGTGITGRDGTPEAIKPLLDKVIDGFGEMFRFISYQKIKTSTLQSRAFAGVAERTYIFCLPGSAGACADAWDNLIKEQLDHRTTPCNLVELMPRLDEK